MKGLKAFFSLTFSVAIFFVLNSKFGDIPPLGKFLDPFAGFWNNAETANQEDKTLQIKGLKAPVNIVFDDHRIPHIFAQNDYDLYFAQGYVTAKDRLWQMDFQSRFASGRLSEVVGKKALELDKYQRRMGMTYGAEKMLEALDKEPKIKETVEAYAAGVNAYIRSLSPADYPIEFKILNYKPEEWTTLNTGLLLKLMSATLTAGSDEFYMTNVLQKFGPEITTNLFPDYPFKSDPIIPIGTKWNFKPVSIPSPGANNPTGISADEKTKQKEEGIGSNNWAVSGTRTASGYPLLANDPHLDLTLPAIWYQIQMNAPGVNVYGVSIPGAPCVIIGFNQNVAWGVTNVGADVLDWYQIKFNDKEEYLYNKQWKKLKKRIETIRIRGGETVKDTVFYTHHGPVVYLKHQKPSFSKSVNVPEGNALRWVAHDRSNDLVTFYRLNRAKNYEDYRQAVSFYTAPAQNFVFASADNDISITSGGYFPLKWKNQGKYILDGSKPENDWQGRIPADQNPTVKNPDRGFVSSANQWPTDQTYPYYINWEFSGYERGHRINTRLAAMSKATVDSMQNLLNDNYSVLAENVLPTLISYVDTKKLSSTGRSALERIKKWDKFYNANEIAASIFEIWHKDLFERIWQDEFGGSAKAMRFPSRDRTVQLVLAEPNAEWFDNKNTPHKETLNELVTASFNTAVDSLQKKFGAPGKDWEWANLKGSHVPHLAGIPAFGSPVLHIGGAKIAVNSLGEKNGPSWKMIVALDKEPRAFGIFPGGQSGNPGSFYYMDMLDTWAKGETKELLFLHSEKDKNPRIKSKWLLTN